ncbi:putative enzyme related to lactoylglutathione lyase [Streptomyces africanus]|uniref:Enzyme related to lactoylglutathione lyase n=1 Tax=Streptomyces africanus TaxID=231024 RepID=A0ABU0QYM6_9ACTN|nr:putative enzyme related to lactoylglutathione lyase [Streptomyces africanus]
MEILGATLRVCVDDLETAIPFYERLAGGRAQRFERGGVQVAAIGCFLLMSAPPAELELLRKVAATIAVTDVEETHKVLTELGAHIIAGPHRLTGGPQPDRPASGRVGLRVRGPPGVIPAGARFSAAPAPGASRR